MFQPRVAGRLRGGESGGQAFLGKAEKFAVACRERGTTRELVDELP
jgi:hypothetical protein